METDTILMLKDLVATYNFLNKQKDSQYLCDTEAFYESDACRILFGQNPTSEQIYKAQHRENGYITRLRGFRLYLIKKIY